MNSSHEHIGRKATRNALYSMLANIWYLLSRFLLTPFILSYLSMAEFGLWSLCFVVMGFLAMTSIGFEGAYIKYVAEFNARGEQNKINSLLSTGLAASTIISLILLGGLYLGMPPLLNILKIEEEMRATASFVFLGTGLVFMLDISLNCFGRALEGLQHIALIARVRLFSTFIEIGLIIVFLLAGFGVYGMMSAFFIRYLFVITVNTVFAYRLIPGLSVNPCFFNTDSLKLFLSYGGKMQLLGFIGIFMSTYDRMIITRLLGLPAAGIYELGRKIPVSGSRIPSEISGAIMPALSHLQGANATEHARELFLQASRYMAMLSAIVFTYFIAVAPQAIFLWLGEGYSEAVFVMVIVSAGTLINLLTGASSAVAKGFAELGWEIRYGLLNLILCILFTPPLTYWLGLAGGALGVAASTAIASIYFITITNNYFTISFYDYCRRVLHPVMACTLSATLVWIALSLNLFSGITSRPLTALILAICGLFHFIASALLLWISFGIETAEKQRFQKLFNQYLVRKSS